MNRLQIVRERFDIDLISSNDHDTVQNFSCGDEDLNRFLKDDAFRLQQKDVCRVYLARYEGELVGYIAVLTDAIELKSGERRKLQLTHTDHPIIPALKIGRLAVTTSARTRMRGIGTFLVQTAFLVAQQVSKYAGCRLITVDAYAQSIGFYESLGFVRNKSSDQPLRSTISLRLDLQIEPIPRWLVE